MNSTNVNVDHKSHIFHLLQVRGYDVGFQTTKEGGFSRILMPGIYTMEVFAEGFFPRQILFSIVEQNPTTLNVTMYLVRFFTHFHSVLTLFAFRTPHEETETQTTNRQLAV